tara:strand:- start:32926 stop:33030 length:105 start_codon:yes stop_codon:yes gene_type:complete
MSMTGMTVREWLIRRRAIQPGGTVFWLGSGCCLA